MTVPDIRPGHNNWRQFCGEEPLTDEEATIWREMAHAICADNTGKLQDFIATATVTEETAYQNAAWAATDDWSGLVQEINANRRYKRAELAAWERWQKEQEVAQ